MFKLAINKNEIINAVNQLSSWEDWYEFKRSVFKTDDWPELTSKQVEDDINREDIVIDGITWEATTNNYDVDPDLIHLYEKCSRLIFEKMEPEAFKENLSNKDEYLRICTKCTRWAKTSKIDFCPVCGEELFMIPIPD